MATAAAWPASVRPAPPARWRTAAPPTQAGRTISIHPHEQILQDHKADQQTAEWQEAYTGTRPKVERKTRPLRLQALGWPQGPHPGHGPCRHRRRHPGRRHQLEPSRCPRCALERRRLGRGWAMTEGTISAPRPRSVRLSWSRSPRKPRNKGGSEGKPTRRDGEERKSQRAQGQHQPLLTLLHPPSSKHAVLEGNTSGVS